MGCVAKACPVRTPFRFCERHAEERVTQLEAEILRLRDGAQPSRRETEVLVLAKRIAAILQPGGVTPPQPRPMPQFDCPEFAAICKVVADHYSVPLATIRGLSHARLAARPRQVAMWLIRQITDASLPMIGHWFGRNHATVLHSLRLVGLWRENPAFVEHLCLPRAESAPSFQFARTSPGRLAVTAKNQQLAGEQRTPTATDPSELCGAFCVADSTRNPPALIALPAARRASPPSAAYCHILFPQLLWLAVRARLEPCSYPNCWPCP
jgi:hypothetical protein